MKRAIVEFNTNIISSIFNNENTIINVDDDMNLLDVLNLLAHKINVSASKKQVWEIHQTNEKGPILGEIITDRNGFEVNAVNNIEIIEMDDIKIYVLRKDKEDTATLYNVLKRAEEYLNTDFQIGQWPLTYYDQRIMDALYSLEPDYKYVKNYPLIKDVPIEEMTLDQIATMYTFIYRGERFCDGHIYGYMENGILRKLILRHLELMK